MRHRERFRQRYADEVAAYVDQTDRRGRGEQASSPVRCECGRWFENAYGRGNHRSVLRDGERCTLDRRCGTLAGYQEHLARGDETCDPCRRANADRVAEWRAS